MHDQCSWRMRTVSIESDQSKLLLLFYRTYFSYFACGAHRCARNLILSFTCNHAWVGEGYEAKQLNCEFSANKSKPMEGKAGPQCIANGDYESACMSSPGWETTICYLLSAYNSRISWWGDLASNCLMAHSCDLSLWTQYLMETSATKCFPADEYFLLKNPEEM